MRKRVISLMLALLLVVGLCPAFAGADYTEMTFSDSLVDYIKTGEGFMPTVYSDGTGWYIGYGCACGQYDYPGGITEAQADALLRQKMGLFAVEVNKFIDRHGITVTQGQFDAMCAMSYNLGTSWLAAGNKLPGMIIKGSENYSDEDIASAFAAWCHIGSTVSEALLVRRIAEAKMFLDDDYSGNADGWKWLICDANGGSVDRKINCYRSGAAYGKLPTASRAGYTLAGWESSDGVLLGANTTVSRNLYVKAKWVEGENADVQQPSTPPEVKPESVFPDVAESDWFYEFVTRLSDEGVISGYDDGTFKPGAYVTWGQALKMITISSGFSAKEAKEGEHWAAGYLSFAEKKGYVPAGSVKNLDAVIKRSDIARLMVEFLELDTTVLPENPFADTNDPNVLALYAEGIFEGSVVDGKRYFKGGDNIKRGEIAKVLCLSSDYVDKYFVCVAGDRARINFDLEMNPYDSSLFRYEGDRIVYDDPELDVRYGIDVSYYQHDIDWEKVAADGVDFAIIRVGYRGYTAGALNMDECFRANIEGAIDAGLDVGVYFFSQAISAAEALEEAEYLLDAIDGYALNYPVVFDWEPLYNYGSRTASYSGKVVTDCAVTFMERIAEAGYIPMMYYNKTMAYLKLDLERLEDYEIWLAQYAVPAPDYIYDFDMWQYGTAAVDGIEGEVDVNISFKDYSK